MEFEFGIARRSQHRITRRVAEIERLVMTLEMRFSGISRVISIDTNVLLRHVLNDDPKQTAKAKRLFYSGETILITDVVLVETFWTLKGKGYSAQKDNIVALVSSLLAEPNITFESNAVVWSALDDPCSQAAIGQVQQRKAKNALLHFRGEIQAGDNKHPKPLIYAIIGLTKATINQL